MSNSWQLPNGPNRHGAGLYRETRGRETTCRQANNPYGHPANCSDCAKARAWQALRDKQALERREADVLRDEYNEQEEAAIEAAMERDLRGEW